MTTIDSNDAAFCRRLTDALGQTGGVREVRAANTMVCKKGYVFDLTTTKAGWWTEKLRAAAPHNSHITTFTASFSPHATPAADFRFAAAKTHNPCTAPCHVAHFDHLHRLRSQATVPTTLTVDVDKWDGIRATAFLPISHPLHVCLFLSPTHQGL